jgi:hypothetical protein
MFSICTNYLAEQIPPEIQLQNDLFYAANQDQSQTKEQWRAFFEKITHEMNTMAFAFIRIERPDPQSHDFTLKESSIQRLLKIALYWLPIAYLLLEVGQLGYLFPFPPDAEAASVSSVAVMIGCAWLLCVWHGIDQITLIITDLASRTF